MNFNIVYHVSLIFNIGYKNCLNYNLTVFYNSKVYILSFT